MDRHTAKGSQLSRRDSVISHVSQAGAPGSTSPEANRAVTNLPKVHQPSVQYHASHDSAYQINHDASAPYTNGTHTHHDTMSQHGLNGFGHDQSYQHDLHQNHASSPIGVSHPNRVGPFTGASPAPNQHQFGSQGDVTPHSTPFVSQQNVMPFNLPPSQYSGGQGVSQPDAGHSYGMTANADYSDPGQQSSEMLMLGNMAMQATVPMFGTDGVLNKSPYVGMPEDFLTYLFNTASPGERSPMSKDMMHNAYSK